jgi:hypothetical protein
MTKIRSSIALVVGCVWALGLGGAALAADMSMPLKAPPPPAPPPLDIHGYVEWDYESFLINPQGNALATKGAETVVAGLDWTLYKSKSGFINRINTGGGIAVDFANSFDGVWNVFSPSQNGVLFDTVFFINAGVTFGQYWTLSDTYYNVYSGDVCGLAACTLATGAAPLPVSAGFGWLNFNELKLTLNDSFTGWPITFNPYVSWYYEFKGDNVGQMPACYTCTVGSDFFIGMTPTLSLKMWGLPQVTLKVPTYVTVGSSGFWGGPGSDGVNTTGSSGGIGMFTTGLTVVWNQTWVPANYGSWYIKGGFQYYDIINTALQQGNAFGVCGTPAASGFGASPLPSCSDWKTKDIVVGFAGIGVGF